MRRTDCKSALSSPVPIYAFEWREALCLAQKQPCLLAQGTRLGGIAFYHVNGSCRAIPASRDEINHEDMAARGEFFRSYPLPVLSAEQNDSQSGKIILIHESRVENRQQAEISWKKVSLVGRYVCCA